jgi:tetratricopeptide (TPR) repeat protein
MQTPAQDAAVAALDQGRPAEARRVLEAERGRSAHVWALLARTYHALGQPAQALTAARRAEAAGLDPRTQHALALYYAQTGNRKRAARLEHQYALSSLADDAACGRAAFLLAETGDRADAIAMGERAIASKGDRYELRSLLARLYEEARRPEKAMEHHQAAIALRPYDEALLAGYGQALLRMGRFQQAVAALEEAQAKFDRSPQIVLALGVAYYSQRRYDDAAGRFVRVMDLDETIEQPYVFLSRMADQVPDLAAALTPRFAAWQERERANPMAPLAYARLLPVGARQALIEESIRRKGDWWESHYELALVHEAARDYSSAARSYERAVGLDARQANAHYRLARVYDRLNRAADAARHRAIHAKLTAHDPAQGGMTP